MRDAASVAAFLAERHGAPVVDLEPLGGGHWSSAWGYRTEGAADRELVVRFSELDLEVERAAMAYASDALPVPDVLDVGDGWAISVRHRGRFLEDVRPDEAERAGPMLAGLLHGLRDAPPADGPSWQGYLLDGLAEREDSPTKGWRATLAAEPDVDAVFEAGKAEVERLVEVIPERRDLVHADLLHGNVLVSDDASRVNAVFSWKCSTRGDWLYDVAWCSFWSAWHPGIAAVDVWSRIDLRDESDVDVRRRCYELQIGTSHLGWYAHTGEDDELRRCAERTAALLGSRPATRRRP